MGFPEKFPSGGKWEILNLKIMQPHNSGFIQSIFIYLSLHNEICDKVIIEEGSSIVLMLIFFNYLTYMEYIITVYFRTFLLPINRSQS